MTSSVNNNSSIYASLGLTGNGSAASSGSSTANAAASGTALNEQDFLQLMTQQLQDQDPLNPVSNSEFFSQIAQFSTVSGISQLNSSFTQLSSQLASSQSLQAAGLIGHGVLVQGNTVQMAGSGMAGAVEVPASGDVTVNIKDSSGALVGTLDLGVQSAGTVPFSWDGKDASGNALPTGHYTITAQVGSGSSAQAATTDVAAVVDSISLASSGLMLNLQGIGQVPFSNVRQIIS
ncbi:flagellar hook assembly protein FlgD [Nevskia soli]|uniref:flagellar hook assembly protein FlgD n=1 Tax=Nevskia soli TaxID=418856 RepID=UPI0004A6B82D|nr:FlgD immunoglobulin-like domain containing protein [Nevskia soli]